MLFKFRTFLTSDYVLLALGNPNGVPLLGNTFTEMYKSKQTNLRSAATAFHLPTISPLKASNFAYFMIQYIYISGMYCDYHPVTLISDILTILPIQRDFNTALGWWFDTGIYTKMAWDVGVNQNWTSIWTIPNRHEKVALNLSNVLPLFIVFGATTMLSIAVFGLEKMCHRRKPIPKNAQLC